MLKKRYIYSLIIFFIIVILGVLFYNYKSNKIEIENTTGETINNIKIVSDDVKSDISIEKDSKQKISLPKDNNKTTIICFYDKNQSSESFEIINKELDIKHSKVVIKSVDEKGKAYIELK
ncbi:MAG: hypothetical protein ACRC1T_04360 [Clostridium chrysemydis]|uniref:hypothetical protein n=1 Tax=Clostridium chrysemydis TaxID=2665504 RepID=UPI003F37712F